MSVSLPRRRPVSAHCAGSARLPVLLLLSTLIPALHAAELDSITVSRSTEGAGYSADGIVEAVRQATVAAQSSGRIVERRVDAGAAVKAGDLLARIDDRAVAQAETAGEAQVAAARAQLANAVAELERTRALFEKQLVGRAVLDRAETAERAARAQVEALSAAAGVTRTERSFSTVTAPYAGLIAAAHVQVGDLAVPGKPLFTLYDPAQMRVVAAVPQSVLGSWQREAPVTLRIRDGNGERLLTAQSATVLPLTDAASQVVSVRLDLAPGENGLLPGQFVKAQFPLAGESRLMIPATALIRRGEMSAVYVLGASGPQLRQVRPGAREGERIEINAGLLDGERIALDPAAAARARRQTAVAGGQ